MQVRQALRTVGFDVIPDGASFRISRGEAGVAPLKTLESDWIVTERVFWEDQIRTGLFLVCNEDTDKAGQVFDLTASVKTALPTSIFEIIPVTPESTRCFGEAGANRLRNGELIKTEVGVVIGWIPEDKAAVVVLNNQPVWYAACSKRDAVFLFQTGLVQRFYELSVAVDGLARVTH